MLGFLSVFIIAAALIQYCALAAPTDPSADHGDQVILKYLGTAGWEIRDSETFILVDPYLSRILLDDSALPSGGSAATGRARGDTRPAHKMTDVVEPDTTTIDAHIRRADFILVTHTHLDHVMDVPYIALKTHAAVVGTESTENVMRAYSVPEEELITVRGGEDYQFGAFSLKVIPSLHSPLNHRRYFSSATAPAGMRAPLRLEQIMPEGGTLAYLIRFHGHQILAFGGNNYIERELEGLHPDVALVGAGVSRKEIYDYTGRLMRVLNYPKLVLPTRRRTGIISSPLLDFSTAGHPVFAVLHPGSPHLLAKEHRPCAWIF